MHRGADRRPVQVGGTDEQPRRDIAVDSLGDLDGLPGQISDPVAVDRRQPPRDVGGQGLALLPDPTDCVELIVAEPLTRATTSSGRGAW